jgi:hypothetical protein
MIAAKKLQVWEKDYGNVTRAKCQMGCGNKINVLMFDVGHDKAKSKGGSDNINNLYAICHACNNEQRTMRKTEYEHKARNIYVTTEEIFEVDFITDYDPSEDLYKVRWKGYGSDWDEWVGRNQLTADPKEYNWMLD